METIIEIANKIKANGGTLYLVGGAVRDEILNRKIKDEDYCITGLNRKDFFLLFPEAKIKGKSFEVYEIANKEFALARREKKTGEGHTNFNINIGKNITIEEDLERRDITINSIAKNILTGEIIDPFNGKEDIKNKIIRATSNAFSEDPLRIYRVARFATELEFDIDSKTIKLMEKSKKELQTLSGERIFIEFSKSLIARKPSIFFQVLKKANVLDVHFKEIYNLIGALQPVKYHPEGDAYNHTMQVLDYAAKETTEKYQNKEFDNRIKEIRFAALVHDLGKGVTPKSEYPHHYNHEINGVELAKSLGDRIKVPKRWIECGEISCDEHMKGGIFNKMTPSKKVSFIEKISKTTLGLDGLQIIVNSDRLSRDIPEQLDINFEIIGENCLKAITATDIMKKYNISEGKQVGEKMHQERVEWIKSLFQWTNL